jgi:archaellum component FlaC
VTIDQRLERLTERHEALTQSLELLTSDLRNLEKHIESLTGYVGEIAEGTARLLHIAQIHEHRITRLEDKDK